MKTLIIALALFLLPFQVSAAPTKEYLAEKYPHLYALEIWDFQQVLQDAIGYQCHGETGKWITYSKRKGWFCVSEQRWAVKNLSRLY